MLCFFQITRFYGLLVENKAKTEVLPSGTKSTKLTNRLEMID